MDRRYSYNEIMLTKADAIALLKVLIAAAWADSRLTQSELNYIKLLAQKFRLVDDDWLQLQPYLEDPPSEKEVNELFEDLLNRIATPFTRNQVVQYLEDMMRADEQITAEEHDFLEHYALVLKHASTTELLLRRTKALFSKQKPQRVVDRFHDEARADAEHALAARVFLQLAHVRARGLAFFDDHLSP